MRSKICLVNFTKIIALLSQSRNFFWSNSEFRGGPMEFRGGHLDQRWALNQCMVCTEICIIPYTFSNRVCTDDVDSCAVYLKRCSNNPYRVDINVRTRKAFQRIIKRFQLVYGVLFVMTVVGIRSRSHVPYRLLRTYMVIICRILKNGWFDLLRHCS